jgi:hypothetical protein
MTQYQLLQAIPALGTLGSLKLPMKKAYGIYNLAKKANEAKDFFIEQEKKLIEDYHAEVNENGQISFKEAEDFKGFNEKYTELKTLEAEGIEPIELSIESLGDQELSAADLASLEGVVNFVD